MKNKHGYGDLTNIISLKRVWMTEHREGTGMIGEDSPMRVVQTFFDNEGQMLARKDIADKP